MAAARAGATPGGEIVHADCGGGELLRVLAASGGADADGVEPRGAVALGALEHGGAVTIAEASEYLATGRRVAGRCGPERGGRPAARCTSCSRSWPGAGGCWQRGAPLVVIAEPVAAAESLNAAARDLVEGRPLHEATWEMLLQRAGFVGPALLSEDRAPDRRLALAAAAPS